MEVTVYEEKKLKYNKTELSEFSEDRKSYYEDEIKYLNEEQILKFLNGISNTFHQMVFSFLFEMAPFVIIYCSLVSGCSHIIM